MFVARAFARSSSASVIVAAASGGGASFEIDRGDVSVARRALTAGDEADLVELALVDRGRFARSSAWVGVDLLRTKKPHPVLQAGSIDRASALHLAWPIDELETGRAGVTDRPPGRAPRHERRGDSLAAGDRRAAPFGAETRRIQRGGGTRARLTRQGR